MFKKISLFICSIVFSHAVLADIDLGQGELVGRAFQDVKLEAALSLSALDPKYYYDLTCYIRKGGSDPASLQFEISMLTPYFDGQPLSTNQKTLQSSDYDTHKIEFHQLKNMTTYNLYLRIIEAGANRISYECHAVPSSGFYNVTH